MLYEVITVVACDYAGVDLSTAQANLDAVVAAWVARKEAELGTAGGCAPTVSSDFSASTIDYCAGGSQTITWTITDLCETQTVDAIITVTPSSAVTFTEPADTTVVACDYAGADLTTAQANLDAAVAAWVIV